jgi:hypothetical protein
MSQHVSQNVSQNPGHPKTPGMYVSTRSQKAEVSQRRPKLCPIKIPKTMGSQSVPKVILNPLPKSTVSQTCPKQTFSNNDVQSDTVSPCGPRGSNSNVVQPSRNNDGIACTNRAFNNSTSAKCYCGKLQETSFTTSGLPKTIFSNMSQIVPSTSHTLPKACLKTSFWDAFGTPLGHFSFH